MQYDILYRIRYLLYVYPTHKYPYIYIYIYIYIYNDNQASIIVNQLNLS